MQGPPQPINRIDIAHYDLYSNEGLDQTILNLSNIEEVFNSITTKIESRLTNSKNKLRQIEERRMICLKKIEALANLNVALTIYSPSKYVKPYKFEENTWKSCIFYDLYMKVHIPRIDTNFLIQHQHSNSELGRMPDIKFEEYTNYVNMLYVRLKQRIEMFEGEFAIQNKRFEGLGEIPSNLKYVETLLVFASKINPYKHYSSFDTFSETRKNRPKKAEERQKEDIIDMAPKTIMDGEQIQHYEQKTYNYQPIAKEITQINLPTDLLLKGIVNLDGTNLGDNSDPFMPSRGGFSKNLPTIPDPKIEGDIQQSEINNDQNNNNIINENNNNQQISNSNQNNSQPSSYIPGSMISFNTFNKGPPPIYVSNTGSTTNNPPVNNQPSKPNVHFNYVNNSNNNNVNNNAQPPSINMNNAGGGIPPPPPSLNLPPPPPISLLMNSGNKTTENKPAQPTPQENQTNQENNVPKPSGGGNDRANLLAEINCGDPMSRLRKVAQNVGKNANAASTAPGGAKKEVKNEPKQSHMDYLRDMVLTRYEAINKKGDKTKKSKNAKIIKAKQSSDSESESNHSDSD